MVVVLFDILAVEREGRFCFLMHGTSHVYWFIQLVVCIYKIKVVMLGLLRVLNYFLWIVLPFILFEGLNWLKSFLLNH